MRSGLFARICAAGVAATLLASCTEAPVGPGSSGVQLVISLASQATASRRVDIVVGYETTNGQVTVLVNNANVTVAPGTQQLTIAVDLTRCLADPSHVGGAGACRLRVSVTLRDGTTGSILDQAELAPITVSPGAAPTAATVTVAAVNTIAVSGLGGSLIVGQTAQATAAVRDASGNALTRPVTWSSSVPAVAQVSANGLVTALAPGTTQITAASGGVSQATTVVVIAAVASVSVSPSTALILVGATAQFTATVRDAAGNVLTGRAVSFSGGSPGVASVSSTGLVTGVAPGIATITATSEGRSGTATVTVIAPPPPPPLTLITVSPSSVSGTHVFAQSSCPQVLGTVTITNTTSGTTVSWGASVPHASVSLSGSTGGTLAPGASANMIVLFNCAQAVNVSATITVTATAGQTTDSRTVGVSVTVQIP